MHLFEMKKNQNMETAATTTTSPPRFPDSSPVGKGHLPTLHPLGNFGASILALSALDPRCFFDKCLLEYLVAYDTVARLSCM